MQVYRLAGSFPNFEIDMLAISTNLIHEMVAQVDPGYHCVVTRSSKKVTPKFLRDYTTDKGACDSHSRTQWRLPVVRQPSRVTDDIGYILIHH